jgi:hypothetical protein
MGVQYLSRVHARVPKQNVPIVPSPKKKARLQFPPSKTKLRSKTSLQQNLRRQYAQQLSPLIGAATATALPQAKPLSWLTLRVATFQSLSNTGPQHLRGPGHSAYGFTLPSNNHIGPFVVVLHFCLAGYQPADKRVATALPRATILRPELPQETPLGFAVGSRPRKSQLSTWTPLPDISSRQ